MTEFFGYLAALAFLTCLFRVLFARFERSEQVPFKVPTTWKEAQRCELPLVMECEEFSADGHPATVYNRAAALAHMRQHPLHPAVIAYSDGLP